MDGWSQMVTPQCGGSGQTPPQPGGKRSPFIPWPPAVCGSRGPFWPGVRDTVSCLQYSRLSVDPARGDQWRQTEGHSPRPVSPLQTQPLFRMWIPLGFKSFAGDVKQRGNQAEESHCGQGHWSRGGRPPRLSCTERGPAPQAAGLGRAGPSVGSAGRGSHLKARPAVPEGRRGHWGGENEETLDSSDRGPAVEDIWGLGAVKARAQERLHVGITLSPPVQGRHRCGCPRDGPRPGPRCPGLSRPCRPQPPRPRAWGPRGPLGSFQDGRGPRGRPRPGLPPQEWRPAFQFVQPLPGRSEPWALLAVPSTSCVSSGEFSTLFNMSPPVN